MAKFGYNNDKNASAGYMPFKPNYGYYLWVLFKEDIDPCLKLKLAKKLLVELWELITIYINNFFYAQKF